jgi:ABC-type uncharacterized transport system substrate-binding protein
MRRRDVLAGLGGLIASSNLGARAQQPAMPVVGFLIGAATDGTYVESLAAVRQGLGENGFVDGQNVSIEYRSAENQYERLPALATDLVQRRVAAIFVTGSIVSALVAKAATSTIPVVFAMGSDPVKYGLVASLGRPGGNVTGVTFYNSDLGPKRLELLHELLPQAAVIGMLVNPNNPNTEADTKGVEAAARVIGVEVVVASVGSERDIETAFADLARRRVDALYVNNDALLQARQRQIIDLAVQHALPAIFTGRPQVVRGGLIGYGASTADMYRRAGVYIGRVLKGAKPADLPVLQPTKFDLVINLKTAKALSLEIPPQLLARADEVIE